MEKNNIKIGFVGAGKMGCSLGQYISLCNDERFTLSGYFSKSQNSSKQASELTNSVQYSNINALAEESDLIFLTVPDGVIAEVWKQLSETAAINSSIAGGIKKCLQHYISNSFVL